MRTNLSDLKRKKLYNGRAYEISFFFSSTTSKKTSLKYQEFEKRKMRQKKSVGVERILNGKLKTKLYVSRILKNELKVIERS